jgi:peptide/nickel transport system substrate-binding protein
MVPETINSSSIANRRLGLPIVAVTVGFVLALTAACSSSTPPPASGGGGTIKIADTEPLQTFDPQQATNSTVDEVDIPLYNALVQYPAGGNQVQGELAKSWSVSSDGLAYTFVLNKGVTFHDGSPFTAADVKYTLDRIKTINTGVATMIANYDSSNVVADDQITVKLTAPYSPFINALTRVYILNSKLMKQNEGSDHGQAWLSNHDAGSGRYSLKKYTTNQEVDFTGYTNYWKGWEGKHAKDVVLLYVVDPGTERALLQRGDIDMAMKINKDDLATFKSTPGFTVDAANTLVQLYFWFNTQKGPTKDPRVRKALAMAYDYDTHVKNILLGYGQKADGPLPVAMPCHLSGVTQPTFDLAAAKQLLADAGYPKFSVKITYMPVIDEMKKAFELLQSNLAQIGVTAIAQPVTFPQYAELTKKVDTTPDLGILYAFPAYPDPDAVMFINFWSKFTGTGFNWSSYSNPQVDKDVTDAQATTDANKRCQLYQDAQKIVADDYVTINASIPQFTTVLRSRVVGYKYNLAHHQTVNIPDLGIN